jgi:hypothetical protein
MTLVSGTLTRYGMGGLRESLADTIYNISPEDTIAMSSMGRGKAKQTLEEWQTDSLAAVDTANAQLEGDDAAFTTPAATVRVGNYTQISRKTLILSDTAEAIDKAGRRSELAYQIAKRGAELKRDIESAILAAQAGDAGGVGTARTFAGINAWVKTNTAVGTSGADPVYTSGVPSAVRTDGTQVAFTETIAKDVLQQCWTSGANVRTVMVGPVNKQKFSAFDGIVVQNLNQTSAAPTSIVAAANVYVSDFGTVRVVPNRFQRERDAWFLDWSMLELLYLRPFATKKLAPTGDAEKRMLIVEYTLKVKQEAGLGLAADLTTT